MLAPSDLQIRALRGVSNASQHVQKVTVSAKPTVATAGTRNHDIIGKALAATLLDNQNDHGDNDMNTVVRTKRIRC